MTCQAASQLSYGPLSTRRILPDAQLLQDQLQVFATEPTQA